MSVTFKPTTVITRHQRLVILLEQLLSEGWSQSRLAATLDVDFSTVYRWLKGKSVPEEDSKNFHRLAKLTGGNSRGLQLYLNGEISLDAYLQHSYDLALVPEKKKKLNQQLKSEILSKIYSLEPQDIAEIISSSVNFLAGKV